MSAGLIVPFSRARRGLGESAVSAQVELLESRLRDLELELWEQGWQRLGDHGGKEFGRAALDRIVDLARAMYLKNPLIRRAVEVGALYVWGQDLSHTTSDPDVEAVIDRFWRDNQSTLTGQQASRLMEVELLTTGNVFLALFPDPITGRVRVRQAPVEEIREIVCNPDDRAEPWYYRREWTEQAVGSDTVTVKRAYYPDWRYRPAGKPAAIVTAAGGETEIRWESPLLHVRAGAFPHWRWGLPELYAALDWAKAYKELLEDDATRSRALARFAWKATAPDKRGVADFKSKLGTTYLGDGLSIESNPPALAGSTAILGPGRDLDPIRVAGATLDPDHSRPVRLMASAGVGLPDHFFDTDVGNHATAKTLDRPTELRFNERRQLWRDVLTELCRWVIDADLAATAGILRGTPTEDARRVELAFPDLLETDVVARVQAIAAAATDNGSADAGTLPSELKSRLYMSALNVEDVDGALQELADEKAKAQADAEKLRQQMQPPPLPPGQQPPNGPQTPQNGAGAPQPTQPGAMTAKPSEAIAEATPKSVTITAEDVVAAEAFFDTLMPEHAGVLSAKQGSGT